MIRFISRNKQEVQIMEEWKIGEIFESGGEWYQCVKSDGTCNGCVGKFQPYSFCNGFKECVGKIFKKLEKVGEPYEYFIQGIGIITVQEYILANANYIWEYSQDVVVMDCQNGKVVIEIKQNKEDMEEKKTNFVEAIDALCKRYNMSDGVRTDFMSELKEIIKDKEKCNLKPFNLEAAKQGKPVCTRDGRKARIICFDRESVASIVALIMDDNNREEIHSYYEDGKSARTQEYRYDLMMLSEKRKGWINVHQYDVYKTKEEAEAKVSDKANYLTTIEIEYWR